MLKPLSIAALAGLAFAQDSTPDLATALSGTDELSTLQGLVPQSLLETLGGAQNITILAPSNSAFEKINAETLESLTSNEGMLAALLQYHVLNGSYLASAIPDDGVFVPSLLTDEMYTNVTGGQVVKAESEDDSVVFYSGLMNNATVTTANVNFTGGVIHIIDTVLSIPMVASEVLTAAGLSSLRGAVVAADLVDTVNTTPNVTIFAPTNEAFQNIGSALGNLSTEDLTSILTYHVVAGTIGYSTGLTNGTQLTTANGAMLTITVGDEGVFVNNAKVVTADVLIANGVVHVIDQVLNPSNMTVSDADNDDDDEGSPAFSGASTVSEAPFTSGQPTMSTTLAGGAAPTGNNDNDNNDDNNDDNNSEQTTNAAAPMQTGAVGMGALFGAAAVYFM